MEVFMDYPNHSNDPVVQKERKMGAARGRSEKNAIRVCGDWSEQLSSKGKIYFYNCITEVSQWQKPVEWKLPDMNHDELLKILKNREQYHDQKMKRSRLSTTVQDATCHDHFGSPKRIRYSNEFQARLNVQQHPPKSRDSQNAIPKTSKYFPQVVPISADSSSPNNQLHKLSSRRPMQTGSRQHPADDMEISPNSSPLSDGSSPACLQNNQSQRFVKCVRSGGPLSTLHRTLADASRSQRPTEYRDNCSKSSEPDSTLRQLVDAIRSSLGGLLDPNATTSRVSPLPSPVKPGQNGLEKPIDPLKSPNLNPLVDRYEASVPSGCILSSGNPVSVTDSQPPTVYSGNRCTHQYRDPSSSINTLGTLISNPKCPTATSGSGPLVSASNTSFRRSTAHHLLPTPPPSCASPTVKSLFNSHYMGRNNVPHASLLINDQSTSISSHQSDEILSHSTQFTGSHPKPTIEYYQTTTPQFCDTGTPSHAHISDRSIHSPSCNLPRFTSYSHRNSLDVRLDRECISGSVPMKFSLDSPSSSRNHQLPEMSNAKDSNSQTPGCYRSLHPHHSPIQKVSRSQLETPLLNLVSLPSHTNSVPSTTSSDCQPQASYSRSTDISSVPSESRSPEDEVISRIDRFLNAPTIQAFVDPTMSSKHIDKGVERLEQEANLEARRFEKLHVLYGELSAESKKLRALVRISEAKLAIHRVKQTALQELMDAIEDRKHLLHLSFSDVL